MHARYALNGTDARAFRQCSDYRHPLVGIEDVCHAYYCITVIIPCQEVFVCYSISVMKWLALVTAVLVVAAIMVNGQKKSAQPAPNQHHTDRVPQPEPPTPPIVVINHEAANPQENRANNHAQSYFSRLLSPETLPNLLLVFAGLGGIGVGVYTLRQIRTQTGLLRQYVEATQNSVMAAQGSTEAMLKSVTLQEIQTRQWLAIEDLEVDSPIIPHNVMETELTLTFQVVNPTKMALTLKDIEITLFEDKDDRLYYRHLEYTLIPDGNYPVSIKIRLVEDAFGKYTKGLYVIPVTGLITFEDAVEKIRHQGFSFDCRRREGKWEFTLPNKPIPRRTKGYKQQQDGKQAN